MKVRCRRTENSKEATGAASRIARSRVIESGRKSAVEGIRRLTSSRARPSRRSARVTTISPELATKIQPNTACATARNYCRGRLPRPRCSRKLGQRVVSIESAEACWPIRGHSTHAPGMRTSVKPRHSRHCHFRSVQCFDGIFWPSRTVSARQRARSSMSVSPRWGDVIQICPLTKRKTKYVAPITEQSTGASASNSVQTRADFLDELRKTKPQILELASASNGGAFYLRQQPRGNSVVARTSRQRGGSRNADSEAAPQSVRVESPCPACRQASACRASLESRTAFCASVLSGRRRDSACRCASHRSTLAPKSRLTRHNRL